MVAAPGGLWGKATWPAGYAHWDAEVFQLFYSTGGTVSSLCDKEHLPQAWDAFNWQSMSSSAVLPGGAHNGALRQGLQLLYHVGVLPLVDMWRGRS